MFMLGKDEVRMKNLDKVLNEINKEENINKVVNLIIEMSIIREALLQKKKELAMFNVVNNVCNKVEIPLNK